MLLFIVGCANLEFVYNDNRPDDKIQNKIQLSVSGNGKPEIIRYFSEKIGSDEEKGSLVLQVISTKSEKNLVTENDGSTLKSEITRSIEYALLKKKERCLISSKTINTRSIYNSKAAGYNFGTDISIAEISKTNIQDNIDEYLNYILAKYDSFKCVNED